MNRPAIDHGILSPSGKVSKRARAAAIRREHDRLFPPGFWDPPAKTDDEVRAEHTGRLRRSARTLRDLANRGMSTRRYLREAARLEDEANAIETGR